MGNSAQEKSDCCGFSSSSWWPFPLAPFPLTLWPLPNTNSTVGPMASRRPYQGDGWYEYAVYCTADAAIKRWAIEKRTCPRLVGTINLRLIL